MDSPNDISSAIGLQDETNPNLSDYATQPKRLSVDIAKCLAGRFSDESKTMDIADRIEKLVSHEEDRNKNGYKESYDFTQTKEIKGYCLDRLKEIRVINEVFHVPSGFVCIAAFIGFLSLLAYGTNKKSGEDHTCFTRFVKKFMTNYAGEKMYSTFRCGIVHAMSFYPAYEKGRPSDKPIQQLAPPPYSITHSAAWPNLAPSSTNGGGLGIQAAALCNDIENAVNAMFDDPNNKSERDNAVKTLTWQPAITGKPVKTATDSPLSD